MHKRNLLKSVAIVSAMSIGLSLLGSQTPSSASSFSEILWKTSSEVSAVPGQIILADIQRLNNIEAGRLVTFESPDKEELTVRIQELSPLHLGGLLLQGQSDDQKINLDMVISAGQSFGSLQINGQPSFLIYSDANSPSTMIPFDSVKLLLGKIEIESLIGTARSLNAGPVIAWISSDFETKYGLATNARLQYIILRINEARRNNGLDPVELLATRKVNPNEQDSVFKATGVSIASADPLSVEEDVALVAAVLPSSRSVKTGIAATAFATVINPGTTDALSCGLVMNGAAPAGVFHFQETNTSNVPVGTQDQTVTIAGGAAQSFVFSFTASTSQSPGLDLPIEFSCSNRVSASIISGLNTLFFSASDADVPDIIAISETGAGVGLNTEAGIVDMVDREKDGAFVVATSNVGVAGEITISATSTAGAAYPVVLSVCQTDSVTGDCLAPPSAETTLTIGAGATPSFAFFASSNTVWQFDPASRRVNISFKEGGVARGSTSVALRTLQGTPALPATMIDYVSIAENLPAHFTQSVGPGTGGGGGGGQGGGPVPPTPISIDNTPTDNPVTNAGASLGRVLFHDKRLSINDTISCSSCHDQSIGFSDPDRLSDGFAGGKTRRHSMGLANARFYGPGAFFWDERAATLEDQVLMPIQDGVEMGMTLPILLPKLQAVGFYPDLFMAAFGDNTITSDRISKALAQFVRSMVSHNSKFDQAYKNGTPDAPDFAGVFTDQERLGMSLFQPVQGSGIQPLGCVSCHRTTVQALDQVQNNGLDANTDSDQGAGNGAFKAPSLRNIAVRPPYMHDGRFNTLEEVIEFYNSGIQDHPNLSTRLRDQQTGQPRRFNLSVQEKAALVAFLKTLTDQDFLVDSRYSDPFKKR